ncbi:MAG: hypothetical protein OXH79_17860 [Boseongicola sp.]|nr:hypothetical protein [Boseongicola sp.]
MHDQTRFDDSHVTAEIPVSDVGNPGLDARGSRRRNETFWTDLPGDEIEVVG